MTTCPAEYWIWLQTALGAGARVDELLAYFGDPEKLYEAGTREWRLSGLLTPKKIESLTRTAPSQTKAVFDECRKRGYTVVTPDSEFYPARLGTLTDFPLVLYVAGDCSVLKETLSIAVVGTRSAGTYGIETAQKLSFSLASAGAVIVSGGALGIDSEAHAGAMLAGGRTVAVLGCGLSYDYLSENAALRRAICRHGALVSEYPPFTAPSRVTFPIRNRLIAGMTLGTVVVEAGVKSGSLITANCALEQGRDVFAVPGDILRTSFDGTNHLIRSGAKPVFTAEDVLSEYEFRYGELIDFDRARTPLNAIPYVDYRHYKRPCGEEPPAPAPAPSVPGEQRSPVRRELGDDVSADARAVYAALRAEPTQVDDLVRETGLSMSAVLAALTELEFADAAESMAGKQYRLKP